MEEKSYEEVAKFFMTLIFTIPLIILKGYILSRFWFWFVLPIFDVIPLSIVTAVGLSMTVSLFTFSLPKKNKYDEESPFWLHEHIIHTLLYLLVWFMGWVVSLFL